MWYNCCHLVFPLNYFSSFSPEVSMTTGKMFGNLFPKDFKYIWMLSWMESHIALRIIWKFQSNFVAVAQVQALIASHSLFLIQFILTIATESTLLKYNFTHIPAYNGILNISLKLLIIYFQILYPQWLHIQATACHPVSSSHMLAIFPNQRPSFSQNYVQNSLQWSLLYSSLSIVSVTSLISITLIYTLRKWDVF